MPNIYWPVYKSLEREIEELSYAIHINDEQLNVYSLQITNLILRAAADIESIAKELYKRHGGSKSTGIKFDEDALKHLQKVWALSDKEVILSSPTCYQSERVLLPFTKSEKRSYGKSKALTYSWNNSYQNLKHDRASSTKFGSLKYLFDIMAALFVLNIYYKAESFELGYELGTQFPESLGSEIFSIKLSKPPSYAVGKAPEYAKTANKACYLLQYTEQSEAELQKFLVEGNQKWQEAISSHPDLQEYVRAGLLNKLTAAQIMKIIGQQSYAQIAADSYGNLPKSKYQAILNTKPVTTA